MRAFLHSIKGKSTSCFESKSHSACSLHFSFSLERKIPCLPAVFSILDRSNAAGTSVLGLSSSKIGVSSYTFPVMMNPSILCSLLLLHFSHRAGHLTLMLGGPACQSVTGVMPGLSASVLLLHLTPPVLRVFRS